MLEKIIFDIRYIKSIVEFGGDTGIFNVGSMLNKSTISPIQAQIKILAIERQLKRFKEKIIF